MTKTTNVRVLREVHGQEQAQILAFLKANDLLFDKVFRICFLKREVKIIQRLVTPF